MIPVILIASLLLAQAATPGAPAAGPPAAGPGATLRPKPGPAQKHFPDPRSAVLALHAAALARDAAALRVLVGTEAAAGMESGDRVADANALARLAERMAGGTRLYWESETRAIVRIGEADWPFPCPLVKHAGRWRFDGVEGLREMLHRRVGRNELDTIRMCRSFVEAQHDYRRRDWDGDGVLEYASRVVSAPGTRNGLVWIDPDGKPAGPFTAIYLEAQKEGYVAELERNHGAPIPFHGYRFRMLDRQGSNAPAGAHDYLINGHRLAGFALLAWPVRWGNSGVMTFQVSDQGKVYQKNLGAGTESAAAAIDAFDPGSGWSLVRD